MPGAIGSPLCAELNRIANNGVYPDRDDFLEEQGAANVWAGTTGQGLLGALNYIVDPNRTENNFSDLTKVCNELAGTRGLSDVDALRTIGHAAEVLLRGTTPQSAAYYTDAATPRYNYPGFIRLDRTSGNYISTPDAPSLDVTGDIDLRAQIALDDWTPPTVIAVIAKDIPAGAGGTTRSYALNVLTSGSLELVWSSTGANAETNNKISTVATGVTDGAVKWIRATLDVDNGAVGNDVKFFLSNDGITWTQLGTTVTTASTTSVFAGTADLLVGARGDNADFLTGKLFRAQIFASIDGTDKRLDVDLTTNVTSATYDQFTATTGQLCTINGQNTLTNAGNGGSLLPTTVGSSLAADSNDPKFLAHTGTNYVYLPGVSLNYLTVPDSAALDITGDIDLRVQLALDDWTPASTQAIIYKYGTAGNRSFAFYVNGSSLGTLELAWSADGTAANSATSSVATGITDGATKWIRATLDVDNGASGRDVKFFTSDDGITWTQLGTTRTSAGVTSIFASTAGIAIGGDNNGSSTIAAKIFNGQILNGIDGTKVLDVNTSIIGSGSATTYSALTGQTVTINRATSGRKTVAVTQPTWLFGTDDYMEVNNRYMAHSGSNYLYLPGVNLNYATAPDSAALDITGDIDLRCKVALDDWTPSTEASFISKWGNSYSYYLSVTPSGFLRLQWLNSLSVGQSKTSTVVTGIADGTTKWVRATLDVDNGASGNDVKFFTSDDGLTWTQLGATVTTAGITNIIVGNALINIGSVETGTVNVTRGKFFRAQVLNGIGGTVAFDANFENSITSLNQTTFTESSTNAATVTINRSGSAFRSAGVIDAGYLYPGATNTFTASAYSLLDFGASDSFTLVAIIRSWSGTTGYRNILSKNGPFSVVPGYHIYTQNSSVVFASAIGDGTTRTFSNDLTITTGSLTNLNLIRNVSTDTLTLSTTAPTTDVTTKSLASPGSSFFVGGSGLNAPDMEFIAAAVFRTVLTLKNISDITNYFNGRD